MASSPEEGVPKEARDTEYNTTISDSTLRNKLPSNIMKMTEKYKFMCGCEFCISYKSMHS